MKKTPTSSEIYQKMLEDNPELIGTGNKDGEERSDKDSWKHEDLERRKKYEKEPGREYFHSSDPRKK